MSFRNLLALATVAVLASVPFADSPKPQAVQVIEGFSLADYRGKAHTLVELQDKPLVVVVFLGTECPLAKLYAPRVQKLSEEYATKGVAFLAINANSQDSITEIAAYARVHAIAFPILKDASNKVADLFDARRTPEAFVLDQGRTVKYRGRIDDQYSIGAARTEPTRRDLAAAIDELLAGQEVSQPVTPAVGCHIGRVKSPDAASRVTYSKDIAAILRDRCVECHRPGEIAPFSLTDYSEVAGWAEMIDEVVQEERMPPWHADPKFGTFLGDRRLGDEDKRLIHEWVANGAPQGDPRELPEPKEYVGGWQLPKEPDLVVEMSHKPFEVPAEGPVQYQYFTADTKFAKERWVQAVEVVPGNRSVVHHVVVFALKPGEDSPDDDSAGFLAAYVPGLRALPFPKRMAKRIPAGGRLLFQVHYTPNGSPQQDLSRIGLVFVDPKTLTHEVQTVVSGNRRIRIPAGADDHPEVSRPKAIPDEAQLLAMMPHMHLRGKSFRYEAVLADGRRQTLLDVPRYDFNWQTAYRLAEPLTFPAGTKIQCAARYDNSAKNLNNPDPTQTVRWGDQTWEEMMLGYFDIATPLLSEYERATARARQIVEQYDTDGDGVIRRTEVARRLHGLFDRLDRASDGELTVDDLRAVLDLLPE